MIRKRTGESQIQANSEELETARRKTDKTREHNNRLRAQRPKVHRGPGSDVGVVRGGVATKAKSEGVKKKKKKKTNSRPGFPWIDDDDDDEVGSQNRESITMHQQPSRRCRQRARETVRAAR